MIQHDIVIIGGGPAGMAAAVAAYDRGVTDVVILERDAHIDQASWGGYIRHNALYRQIKAADGHLLEEQFLFENDAIMMYSPLLPK